MDSDRSKGQNRGNDRLRLAAMVDERQSRVASYKVQGKSVRQIVRALADDGHVNPRSGKPWSRAIVQTDIEALDARWKAEALRNISELKARELERIDQVEREAWAAWHRSIGKKQRTVTERNQGGRGGGTKARVETEDLAGDPRFLAIVNECRKQRRELLGLDAPTKVAPTTPDGAQPLPARIEVALVPAPPLTAAAAAPSSQTPDAG